MSKHPTRLTVLGQGTKPMYLLYRCECGVVKEIRSCHVRGGRVISCGCFNQEQRKLSNRTHGRSRTTEYKIWSKMIARCEKQTDKAYANYGGRGITVCDRWRKSFAAFYEDMGPRPSLQHSIDRINNDGNYEPGNCRWATDSQQARNKRNNVVIEVNGERRTATEWSEITGISAHIIYMRISALGWNPARAVTEPVQIQVKKGRSKQ